MKRVIITTKEGYVWEGFLEEETQLQVQLYDTTMTTSNKTSKVGRVGIWKNRITLIKEL